MTRTSVDFGIDLGTTNSAIAIAQDQGAAVIKNNENQDITSSAVWFDRRGALVVGRRAKEQSDSDSDNSQLEFKRHMGTAFRKRFARANREMTPEELSAEVLKSLRDDVRQQLGEDVRSAVITIPAEFDLPENESTRQAAKIAGFEYVELLQEPIAAALAYGFKSDKDNVFWLVYDFGGGTFDAAVLQLRDGMIQVINHGGDKFLGGKDIDWAIVEQVLIPAVEAEFDVEEFSRGNLDWVHAMARLKREAEKAKIALSRAPSYQIVIDDLFKGCASFDGEPTDFELTLEKGEIEPLMEPFVARSINICRRVLTEKGLSPDHVEKVILVGGPTHTPYFRTRLSDPSTGLGIALDHSIDPMTVVARGAAMYAATVVNPVQSVTEAALGTYTINLDYSPVGSDLEPVVGGIITTVDTEDFEGYTIEFINSEAQPAWRSGKLPVAEKGAFMTSLWASADKPNTYEIVLCSQTGARCPTTPEQLTYRVGKDVSAPPLTHSIGIALETGGVKFLIEKGTPLPCRVRTTVTQDYFVGSGSPNKVVIPVVEGDNPRRAERNREIGRLEIERTAIQRDLPPKSLIEVTVEVDRSRLVKVEAFVPFLDQEFSAIAFLQKQLHAYNDLKLKVNSAMQRLEDVRRKERYTENQEVKEVLTRIESEGNREAIYSDLLVAKVDPDAANKVASDIVRLQQDLDEASDLLEWPTLVQKAHQEMTRAAQMVGSHGTEQEKRAFSDLEAEVKAAIRDKSVDLLRLRIEALSDLYHRLYWQQASSWTSAFDHLVTRQGIMSDPDGAAELFERGRTAVRAQDTDSLKQVVFALWAMLPKEDRETATRGFGSTVTIHEQAG